MHGCGEQIRLEAFGKGVLAVLTEIQWIPSAASSLTLLLVGQVRARLTCALLTLPNAASSLTLLPLVQVRARWFVFAVLTHPLTFLTTNRSLGALIFGLCIGARFENWFALTAKHAVPFATGASIPAVCL